MLYGQIILILHHIQQLIKKISSPDRSYLCSIFTQIQRLPIKMKIKKKPVLPLHISLDSDIVMPNYLTVWRHQDDPFPKPAQQKKL